MLLKDNGETKINNDYNSKTLLQQPYYRPDITFFAVMFNSSLKNPLYASCIKK